MIYNEKSLLRDNLEPITIRNKIINHIFKVNWHSDIFWYYREWIWEKWC